MSYKEESYIRSSSTTCLCESCKLARPPGPSRNSVARRATPTRVGNRDPRKPLACEIRFAGMSEDLWVVRTRGGVWRVCTHESAVDVFRWLNGPFLKY